MSFNVLHDPWLPVLRLDGTVEELGILDVLSSAHEIEDLALGTPTEQVSVLRMLLAFVRRSLDEPSPGRWVEEWESGRFDPGTLRGYAAPLEERFNLDGPTPFLQTPQLAGDKARSWGEQMTDASALFSTRSGAALDAISEAEAVRWLLLTHAFDVSGIKTGSVHDPLTQGGKGYGIGTAWAGCLSNLYAVGPTLFATLLLNLVPAGSNAYPEPAEDDLPAWERPVTTALRGDRIPTGPCDVLTWSSCRLLLHRDETGSITGAVRCQGDRATPQNRYGIEHLSLWRYSKPQSVKSGRTEFWPAMVDPSRALWRGIAQLSPKVAVVAAGTDIRVPEPVVVSWVAEASDYGAVLPEVIDWRQVGIEYGTQSAVIEQVVSDHADVPRVAGTDPDVARTAESGVGTAGAAANSVGWLATLLAEACGLGPAQRDAARDRGAATAYAALDGPVRAWIVSLASLGPQSEAADFDAATDALRAEVADVCTEVGRRLVDEVPLAAWRPGDRGAVDPAQAYERFSTALRKHTTPIGGRL